eukprot:1247857-Rhodomonas_salina.1
MPNVTIDKLEYNICTGAHVKVCSAELPPKGKLWQHQLLLFSSTAHAPMSPFADRCALLSLIHISEPTRPRLI